MTVDRREFGYFGVAGLALLACALQLVHLAAVRAGVEISKTAPAQERSPGRFSDGTDQFIVNAASGAGVARLESVEIRGTAREQIRAEWLGSSASALALLAASESRGIRGQRVHVAATPQGARWTLSGEPAGVRVAGTSVPRINRDPWASRQLPVSSTAPVAVRPRSRKNEQAAKEREERQRADAAALAETRRLDQRRRDITTGVSLSATMSDGREAVALAEVSEGGRRHTVTLRRGDSVLGAVVAGIDEHAGAVQLDIDGKIRVDLHVPGSGTP